MVCGKLQTQLLVSLSINNDFFLPFFPSEQALGFLMIFIVVLLGSSSRVTVGLLAASLINALPPPCPGMFADVLYSFYCMRDGLNFTFEILKAWNIVS